MFHCTTAGFSCRHRYESAEKWEKTSSHSVRYNSRIALRNTVSSHCAVYFSKKKQMYAHTFAPNWPSMNLIQNLIFFLRKKQKRTFLCIKNLQAVAASEARCHEWNFFLLCDARVLIVRRKKFVILSFNFLFTYDNVSTCVSDNRALVSLWVT